MKLSPQNWTFSFTNVDVGVVTMPIGYVETTVLEDFFFIIVHTLAIFGCKKKKKNLFSYAFIKEMVWEFFLMGKLVTHCSCGRARATLKRYSK